MHSSVIAKLAERRCIVSTLNTKNRSCSSAKLY